MGSIRIGIVEPKEGLQLKAVLLECRMNHVSPCCNRIYQRFYCQNRIAEQSWSHKIDASGDCIFNKRTTILKEHIVIPEFDSLLNIAENIDFESLNY